MKTTHPPRWNKRFLKLAKEVSSWSKDPSTKVGAVIVRPDKTVAAIGYNGFPRGMSDNDDFLNNRDEKYARMIHAEINAINSCRDQDMIGYTMYGTFMCCDRCFVQLANKGIKEFVSPTPTPDELVRWGKYFINTKRFAEEMGIPLFEIQL
jgi:dCMP deaminase